MCHPLTHLWAFAMLVFLPVLAFPLSFLSPFTLCNFYPSFRSQVFLLRRLHRPLASSSELGAPPLFSHKPLQFPFSLHFIILACLIVCLPWRLILCGDYNYWHLPDVQQRSHGICQLYAGREGGCGLAPQKLPVSWGKEEKTSYADRIFSFGMSHVQVSKVTNCGIAKLSCF